MLGTAFPAARLLLVEQPGAWGRAGLRESDFDPAVARELERRGNGVGLRVQAIRRPGRSSAAPARRWAIVDTRPGQERTVWGEYRDDSDLLGLALDEPSGIVDEQPLYLVCAHGSHDACCAIRGRAVARALHDLRPGRVWETSHVGGDRFAANVLVLPSGLMYGQVLAVAAEEFVAAAESGEVVGALLRGRIGLPPAAQAALAFGYEHLALRDRNALHVVHTGPTVDGLATVRLDGPHGPVDVTVHVEKVEADGLTCANPRPNRFFAYRPVRLTPAM